MEEKQRNTLLIIGAVILLVAAAAIIGWQMTRPTETINDYKAIPPKGAGKFDRG